MSRHITIWQCGWQYPEGVPEHSWRNPDRRNFWPTHPRTPGRYLKRQKRPEGPLMDDCPTKRFKIEKVSLFDTLPVEILSIINDYAIRFEYNNKCIAVMHWIIQKNLVLFKLSYKRLKPFHDFGTLSFYGTARYEWSHKHYTKYHTGFGPESHLTKNNPAWAD